MSVFIPKGRGHYYYKFRWQGRQYFGSCHTTLKRIALDYEKRIREKIVHGAWREVDDMRNRSRFDPIGSIFDYWKMRGTTLAHHKHPDGIRKNTLRAYLSCLKAMLDAVYPGQDHRAHRLTVLDADFVRRYQLSQTDRSKYSINSTVRQARSLFSETLRAAYTAAGISLPDLTTFLCAKNIREKNGTDIGYDPIPSDQIRTMDRLAWTTLRDDDFPTFLAWLLIRYGGLRNTEAAAARKRWLDSTGRIVIIPRPDEGFDPKGYSGAVPLPDEVITVLRAYLADKHDDDHIIPAASSHARHEICYRHLQRWLLDRVPALTERNKNAYELRKHAGSEVLTSQGLEAAQKFLRHANVNTTMRWYATLLKPVRPLKVRR